MTQADQVSQQLAALKNSPLPIDIEPGWWGRFTRAKSYSIHHDRVIESDGEIKREILFDLIKEVESTADLVRLRCDDSVDVTLHCRGAGQVLCELLRKLISEEKRLKEILQSNWEVADGAGFLDEVTDWRGRPFVAGVEILLVLALRTEATDIHFEPLKDGSKVTLRASGEVFELCRLRAKFHAGLMARLKHLAGCRAHETGISQEGAFSSPQTESEVRFSVFPSVNGERASLRFIRPVRFKNLSSLGWPEEIETHWRGLLKTDSGLLLITGPVGSGKTTALYASLSEITAFGDGKRVVAVEDPVEGYVESICQSSIDARSGLSLSEAFKKMLRQDPDVLALGEIRDRDSLREVLQAGLAGHLVLATMHSADPKGTIDRIRQMTGDEFLLASSLKAIVSLRLNFNVKVDTSDGRRIKPSVGVTLSEVSFGTTGSVIELNQIGSG